MVWLIYESFQLKTAIPTALVLRCSMLLSLIKIYGGDYERVANSVLSCQNQYYFILYTSVMKIYTEIFNLPLVWNPQVAGDYNLFHLETMGTAVSLATFGMLSLSAIHHHFDPQSGSRSTSISINGPDVENMHIEYTSAQYSEHIKWAQMNRRLLGPDDSNELNDNDVEDPSARRESDVAADIVDLLRAAVNEADVFDKQLGDDSWTQEKAFKLADEMKAIAAKFTGELKEYLDRHQDVRTGTSEDISELAQWIQEQTETVNGKLEKIIKNWKSKLEDYPLPEEQIQYHNDQIKKQKAAQKAKEAATEEEKAKTDGEPAAAEEAATKEKKLRHRDLQWLKYSGIYAQWELSKLWNLVQTYNKIRSSAIPMHATP